jgi:hypothetical protein
MQVLVTDIPRVGEQTGVDFRIEKETLVKIMKGYIERLHVLIDLHDEYADNKIADYFAETLNTNSRRVDAQEKSGVR